MAVDPIYTTPKATSLSGWTRTFLFLVGFSLTGSLVSALTGLNPGPIAPLASALTLLCGFVAIFQPVAWAVRAPRAYLALLAVFVVGITSEIVGLYTGFPFGNYIYTDKWWPTLKLPSGHFFPALLPFAWMMVAGGAFLVAARFTRGFAVVILGALLATLIDVPMEPVMTKTLGYWTWLDGGPVLGAPLMNAFGWFLTSLLAGLILFRVNAQRAAESRDPAWVLGGFLVLVLGLGLIGLV